MVYKWKGYNFGVDANKVGSEFEKIEKEYGEITSALVVEKARSKKSVLHSLFEWDNEKAAESYRQYQATRIICALVVEEETKDAEEKTIAIRAYGNVAEERKGRFINIKSAMQNEEHREVILRDALRRLIAFKEAYSQFVEFAKLFDEIDSLQDMFSDIA